MTLFLKGTKKCFDDLIDTYPPLQILILVLRTDILKVKC